MTKVLEEVGFVHLHVHSAFSLLEGALPIATLAKLAKADAMPALALTDTNNLFGALEFAEKMAGVGIQPIAGIQLSVAFPAAEEERHARPEPLPSLVLLAASGEGYQNLLQLSSKAFLETADAHQPHVTWAQLAAHAQGLIALTGGRNGPLDRALRAGKSAMAGQWLDEMARAFDSRLYLELQRTGHNDERQMEAQLLDLAYRKGLPLVATNDAYFGKPDDYEAHDALICIAEGRYVSEDNRRRLTPDHYFRTRREMQTLFADLPEATANSVEIALRCAYRPKKRGPILPRFTAGADAGEDAEAQELRRQAEAGLRLRLAEHGPAHDLTEADYFARLAFELDVITRMKYPGYFLIVADFIKWAKQQDIPVGPGRGSGAGSLVAYSLTITDLDPLRFGLLFERFLNPDRVSMPDFDIDFCQDRRDEVIGYVQQRYGQDRVAQIITFGTLLARGVMRDVGRVLEMPYGQVDRLTKMVPQNPAKPVTLQQAIGEEPRLKQAAEEEPIVGRMLTIAQKLEGLFRHASTHAAGIVIGDRPLDQLVPLYRDPKSNMPVTQFNMKWVEPAGLVKFDFLGLKTLTVLKTAVTMLQKRGVTIDLARIPLDDPKTYEILGRGETVGIFQVESAGMRRALSEMRASRLEDIIALVALYRPGPMANIPVYCARKAGLEKPDYLHPLLQPILEETYGIIVYQEQVMQAAQILSGYSLGEADLLRRAMGKKIKAEMDNQRSRFVTGAVERGVPEPKAKEIFDLLEKFADYGFNKSHAAAYALISYQTAWLKANYPVEFLAASMTLESGNLDKVAEFHLEAKRLGIRVEKPSINLSGVDFDVRDGVIYYALSAIKGVGRQAAEHIIEQRGAQPYTNVASFAQRISARLINKRVLEALISAGALDCIDQDRAGLIAVTDQILAIANHAADATQSGQNDMFGLGGDQAIRAVPCEPWTPQVRLQREHQAVGFYLSGHPLDDYARVLARQNIVPFSAFVQSIRGGATAGRLAASVLGRAERKTKSGAKLGIVTLSDTSGQFEATLFAEKLGQYRDVLDNGALVVLHVTASLDGDEMRVRIQHVESLEKMSANQNASAKIYVRENCQLSSLLARLDRKGDGDVTVVALVDEGRREVEVRLPGHYRLTPQISGALRSVQGVVSVELV